MKLYVYAIPKCLNGASRIARFLHHFGIRAYKQNGASPYYYCTVCGHSDITHP